MRGKSLTPPARTAELLVVSPDSAPDLAKPGGDGSRDLRWMPGQRVRLACQHDQAVHVGRFWYPERVPVAIDHEHRHTCRTQFRCAGAFGYLGFPRRMQRKGQRDNGD